MRFFRAGYTICTTRGNLILFLTKRNRTYYLRVRVPLDMVRHFGRGEIVKSLRTNSYKQATGLATRMLGKLQEAYTMARSGVLTDEQIAKIVDNIVQRNVSSFDVGRVRGTVYEGSDDWSRELQSELEQYHTTLDATVQTDSGYQSVLDARSARIARNRQLLGRNMAASDPAISSEARYHLQQMNVPADASGADYHKLCNEIAKAVILADSVVLEHLRGNFDTPYDIDQRSKPKSNRLSEVIEAFAGLKIKLSARTVGKYDDTTRKILDCLEAETGKQDILLSDIDYPLTKRLVDRLATYPQYRFTRYPDMTLDETYKAANYEPPSPSTLEGDLFRLGALFKLALSKFEGLKKNYMEGEAANVVPDDGKKSNEYRDIFRPADLQHVVATLLQYKVRGEFARNPHLLLVPLIAMFQGFRINEICQLRTDDIQRIDGVWCISINEDGEGMSVKNRNSKRTNPLHPELEKRGLLRFWDKQKSNGYTRLWEGEQKISCEYYPKAGNHSHYLSKWFNGTFKNHLMLSNPEKQTFHSFRHTFLNWFRQNLNMIEHGEAVAALSGHLDKTDLSVLKAQGWDVGNEGAVTYMKDLNVKRQYETLRLLDYKLDLSGLVI